MSAPLVEYGYVDGVECLGDYRPGGYHPIHINDRLDKRYRIVHKLGHGTFSTAWLAIDEKISKYVAVKVSTADADRTEVDVLSQLTHSAEGYVDSADKPSLVPVALDHFEISGPNGTHQYLVTLPARCSLRDAREASGSSLFQLDVARSLAAQLVMAVTLVHSQGYAHGGEHPILPNVHNCADSRSQISILAIFFLSCPHPSTTYRYGNCTRGMGSRSKSQSFV